MASADGTFRDWMSDSRSDFPSSPPSIASAASGALDSGSPALPAVHTRPQVPVCSGFYAFSGLRPATNISQPLDEVN